ncbi:MAG: hypothetical protein KC994_10630, partial [Candidatus Omnitrophica bacterium]|nr:hypothetical protein [Candidatus Omnitrophota bacterium]
ILFVALLFVPFPTSRLETRYEVIDLGILPGENQSIAFDINNHGQVVGSSGSSAFLWDPEEGMKEIAENCWNCKINDKGEILGYGRVPDASGNLENRLLLMNEHQEYIDRGFGVYDSSFDLNDRGRIIWTGKFPFSRKIQGFVRDVSGVTSEIILPNLTLHRVREINNQGMVLGTSKDSQNVYRAFLLDAEGGFESLNPDSSKKGHFFGELLNDEGWVVGNLSKPQKEDSYFLWNGNSFSKLSTLGGSSFALDMNNRGQIVGSSFTFQSQLRETVSDGTRALLKDIPFGKTALMMAGIWDRRREVPRPVIWEGEEVYDLNRFLSSDTDWELIGASAINDKGEIVGHGYRGDWKHVRAFLLRPVQTED